MRLYNPLSFLLVVLTLVVVGCATTPTRTFNDQLSIGYETVTVVYEVTAAALRAHKVSVQDAKNIQAQADNVRDGLDIARDLYTAKDAAANDKLASAIATLNALQTYLANHQ